MNSEITIMAEQCCFQEWIAWLRWWKHRWGTSRIYLILFIFFCGRCVERIKGLIWEGTAGFCYTSGCQKAGSSGYAVLLNNQPCKEPDAVTPHVQFREGYVP